MSRHSQHSVKRQRLDTVRHERKAQSQQDSFDHRYNRILGNKQSIGSTFRPKPSAQPQSSSSNSSSLSQRRKLSRSGFKVGPVKIPLNSAAANIDIIPQYPMSGGSQVGVGQKYLEGAAGASERANAPISTPIPSIFPQSSLGTNGSTISDTRTTLIRPPPSPSDYLSDRQVQDGPSLMQMAAVPSLSPFGFLNTPTPGNSGNSGQSFSRIPGHPNSASNSTQVKPKSSPVDSRSRSNFDSKSKFEARFEARFEMKDSEARGDGVKPLSLRRGHVLRSLSVKTDGRPKQEVVEIPSASSATNGQAFAAPRPSTRKREREETGSSMNFPNLFPTPPSSRVGGGILTPSLTNLMNIASPIRSAVGIGGGVGSAYFPSPAVRGGVSFGNIGTPTQNEPADTEAEGIQALAQMARSSEAESSQG
eukprot:CAMPEP_0167747646 /NCGR_PEP_ID=MMETSP0110_2-20121227/4399_1 /TAXON_ID=629695 /ORGANISM="Gymnochlora sp., Strain CCMP2014" /LENGTH=419 /DNA_ID=CAMNT_0007632575 /DNA_START=440 /DNA_END=1699 /DNA_ORIENTATION=-